MDSDGDRIDEPEYVVRYNRSTRCPDCYIKLVFSDDEDGDEVIADHLWTCEKRK